MNFSRISVFFLLGRWKYCIILHITLSNCDVTSECITVDFLGTQGHIAEVTSIYPNPNTGFFTVDTGNSTADSILVIDTLGRIIAKYTPVDRKTLVKIEPYGDGVYYVRVRQKGIEIVRKIVKRG